MVALVLSGLVLDRGKRDATAAEGSERGLFLPVQTFPSSPAFFP